MVGDFDFNILDVVLDHIPSYTPIIRRPLPTAERGRQRSNYTQQVVHAASVKVPTQKQKCLANPKKKGKGKSNQAARARSNQARRR